MKENYNILNSYSYSHSKSEAGDFFSEANLNEIENDICHLQTYSLTEHRKLGRSIYSKIRKQLTNAKNEKEKTQLNLLANLIKMKISTL
jgi:hypothetical protein